MLGITEEDKDIAFESIILDILITALEKDITAIEKSNLKLKNGHLSILKKVHKLVSDDLIQIKKTLRQKGIKLLDKRKVNADFWQYPYLVRGYEGEFRFFSYALRNYTEKKLISYLNIKEP